MKRVLVCGSRHWPDPSQEWVVLDAIEPSVVIEGCADGADRTAERWAEYHRVPIEHYPAHWDLYGKAAGPMRNREMLAHSHPDLVLAFRARGISRGTDNMVELADKAGVPYTIIFEPPAAASIDQVLRRKA